MKKHAVRGKSVPLTEIPVFTNQVTLGANPEHQLVSMIFGDPMAPVPQFVTFTPAQAREIGGMLHVYADLAEGKRAS